MLKEFSIKTTINHCDAMNGSTTHKIDLMLNRVCFIAYVDYDWVETVIDLVKVKFSLDECSMIDEKWLFLIKIN